MKKVSWPNFKRSLVAILRGIRPDETQAIVGGLIEEGFEAIEIPLNSPNAFTSIEIAAKLAPDHVVIGAGTVLETSDVDQLADAGGTLLVAPNVNIEVLARGTEKGMITMPGVFTATEALLAIKHGASGLKFFPANVLGPSGINAIRAVLPSDTVVGAVGGVGHSDFEAYAKAGISAFGLGSSLYKPGLSAAEVQARARSTISAYDNAFSS